jgi:hypothetical protein
LDDWRFDSEAQKPFSALSDTFCFNVGKSVTVFLGVRIRNCYQQVVAELRLCGIT